MSNKALGDSRVKANIENFSKNMVVDFFSKDESGNFSVDTSKTPLFMNKMKNQYKKIRELMAVGADDKDDTIGIQLDGYESRFNRPNAPKPSSDFDLYSFNGIDYIKTEPESPVSKFKLKTPRDAYLFALVSNLETIRLPVKMDGGIVLVDSFKINKKSVAENVFEALHPETISQHNLNTLTFQFQDKDKDRDLDFENSLPIYEPTQDTSKTSDKINIFDKLGDKKNIPGSYLLLSHRGNPTARTAESLKRERLNGASAASAAGILSRIAASSSETEMTPVEISQMDAGLNWFNLCAGSPKVPSIQNNRTGLGKFFKYLWPKWSTENLEKIYNFTDGRSQIEFFEYIKSHPEIMKEINDDESDTRDAGPRSVYIDELARINKIPFAGGRKSRRLRRKKTRSRKSKKSKRTKRSRS